MMDAKIIGMLGAGLVMGIAAAGSAIGIGIAGTAAIGAAKRCLKANKPAPMMLLALSSFPLSQTLYGFVLMLQMLGVTVTPDNAGQMLGFGIAGGFAIAFSAIGQGKGAAAACDALTDTGKGLAFYIGILGIVESIALFAMVFTMMNLG